MWRKKGRVSLIFDILFVVGQIDLGLFWITSDFCLVLANYKTVFKSMSVGVGENALQLPFHLHTYFRIISNGNIIPVFGVFLGNWMPIFL